MPTHLAGAFFGVLSSLTLAASSPAPALDHAHGRVVAIDTTKGTFQFHHDAFRAMPMAMTMEVRPADRADLRKLHAGEWIDVLVDTSTDPWTVSRIVPAPSPAPSGAQR
jgi:Cu/Ag efflux protein CusF